MNGLHWRHWPVFLENAAAEKRDEAPLFYNKSLAALRVQANGSVARVVSGSQVLVVSTRTGLSSVLRRVEIIICLVRAPGLLAVRGRVACIRIGCHAALGMDALDARHAP